MRPPLVPLAFSLVFCHVALLPGCARQDSVATALAPADVAGTNVQALLAADIAVVHEPEPPPVHANLVPPDCGAARAGQIADPFVEWKALTADAEVLAVLEELARGPATRAHAERLKARGDAAGAALANALWADNPNLRSKAATLLAELEPAPTPAIEAALQRALLFEPLAHARSATARALVDYKVQATVPALIEVVGKDGDENARSHACYALGALRAKDAVPALVKACSDPATWVRIRAVSALGRIGGKEAQAAIAKALRDPNDQVRGAAQRAKH